VEARKMSIERTKEEVVCKLCGRKLEAYTPIAGECPSCNEYELVESSKLIDPNLEWGTYGKSGKDPLKHIKLGDCDLDHLIAILRDTYIGKLHISYQYEETIKHLVAIKENKIISEIETRDLPLHINEDFFSTEARDYFKVRIERGV
jgi:hypothetical protein